MSDYADLLTIAAMPWDAHFGESVRIEPQLVGSSNSAVEGGPDPDRPVRTVTGIFSDDTDIVESKGSGSNNHQNADTLRHKTSVEFAADLFTDADLPVKGWFLVATEQARQPRYSVVTVEPDGYGRVVCRIAFKEYAA